MDQFRSIIQRGWTLGGGPFLRFVQSGCGFESVLLGGGYGCCLVSGGILTPPARTKRMSVIPRKPKVDFR
jgi:hypothetical protein